jgi:hypothetical protein
MEEATSGTAATLLAKIRLLSRRGAVARRHGDGGGVIHQADGRRPAEPLTPSDFIGMLDAGWIRSAGADAFVISRRGAAALRNHLNRPRGERNARLHEAREDRPAAPERTAPAFNGKESPLAWLRQRRDKNGRPLISAVELEAGERLRADFELAQLGPRVTASWDPGAVPSRQVRGAPGMGLEMSDVLVAARQRLDAALSAVGPELSGMLIDVCCFLIGLEQAERNGGWPRRAGKVVLQLALAHLARHYGLVQGNGARSRPRVWHNPDWASSAGGEGS